MENEEEMVARYLDAKQKYEAEADRVGKHFMLKAKDHLQAGNIEAAREVMRQCPDTVTSAFISVAIMMQERGDFHEERVHP